MRHLRYWLAALSIWLAALYNVERWNEPINIASFFYVYILVIVVAVLLIPWLQQQRRRLLFLVTLPPYFLLKIYLGYPLGGRSLPITVTEVVALLITVVLARQVAYYAKELQEAVVELTSNHLYRGTYRFETGQGQIYREIRRARRYERPAALLAVAPTPQSRELTIERFVKDAHDEMVKRYVAGRAARLLKEVLPDCDVIAQRNDHFIVLMPEVEHQEVEAIVERLRAAADERLGLSFAIGAASFPEQAVTFESLLDQAERDMKDALQAENGLAPEHLGSPQTVDYPVSAD